MPKIILDLPCGHKKPLDLVWAKDGNIIEIQGMKERRWECPECGTKYVIAVVVDRWVPPAENIATPDVTKDIPEPPPETKGKKGKR